MPRIVKSGLIQMSLPMTEGEGSIREIMDAMIEKHIPYIEEAGQKGFFVFRKYLIPPISVLVKTGNGTNLQSLSLARSSKECRNMPANTKW
jgi:hypothetical protein